LQNQRCKVLFIGNSHTYYNDMVYMLKYFSEKGNTGHNIEPVIIVHPGRSLEIHKTEPEIRFNILYGDFDYIVMQQTAHPFPGKEVLIRDALQINEYIKRTKAVPVSYMTWAEKDKPENQGPMSDAYMALTKEMNGILCPVGLAWQNVRSADQGIDLFDQDGEHANPAGSYLTACVFYGTLLKSSPIGLSNTVMYGNEIICHIRKDISLLLQQIAWETIRSIL
jgi:hypothetical protein